MGANVGLGTKKDFVLGASTKGNKRASKCGGKYERAGRSLNENGVRQETVTVNESIHIYTYAGDTICVFVYNRIFYKLRLFIEVEIIAHNPGN